MKLNTPILVYHVPSNDFRKVKLDPDIRPDIKFNHQNCTQYRVTYQNVIIRKRNIFDADQTICGSVIRPDTLPDIRLAHINE